MFNIYSNDFLSQINKKQFDILCIICLSKLIFAVLSFSPRRILMKIRGNVKVEKNESVIQDIFCNICGEKIHKNEHGYYDDFLSIEKKWGYHSQFDSETHYIDICQSCYKVFLGKLKLEPTCGTAE